MIGNEGREISSCATPPTLTPVSHLHLHQLCVHKRDGTAERKKIKMEEGHGDMTIILSDVRASLFARFFCLSTLL